MANYEVLDSVPEEYKELYIKSGNNGSCYKTAFGDAFKEFFSFFPYEYELQKLTELKSPYFAFPNTITYIGRKNSNTIVGYKMDYVDGMFFDQLDIETKMERIIKASINIENEIIELTKRYGILLYDLNNGNILFTNDNEFKIVDTDFYEFATGSEMYENIKANIKLWNEYLLYSLSCIMNEFKSDRLNLRHEIAIINGKMRASNFILELLEEIRKETKEEPQTLEEYYRGLKLIKKINQ